MQLKSVNVSLTKEIEYNGELIKTGIFKQPVSGSVTISATQINGDQQADLKNHGGEHKAVYGFASNHYDYWRKELNKPELSYGQFGENLSISDLDEASLCIGDQLQLGDCILEISQPRVPCFKLGMVMGLPTMPKLFIEHAHTGIYFRIIQAGTVESGQTVERILAHPEQLSVQTLFKAYFNKQFVGADKVMQQAETIGQLSTEWRQKVLSRLK
ncbi:molybdenum cofactor biosysynthesis protein [Methylophaga sp. 41_12_T18]|nr:molybdenum cofactor biosysynthesis protein [Methylophaga sp. 41_12_T18]